MKVYRAVLRSAWQNSRMPSYRMVVPVAPLIHPASRQLAHSTINLPSCLQRRLEGLKDFHIFTNESCPSEPANLFTNHLIIKPFDIRVRLHSFSCRYPVALVPFLEKTPTAFVSLHHPNSWF